MKYPPKAAIGEYVSYPITYLDYVSVGSATGKTINHYATTVAYAYQVSSNTYEVAIPYTVGESRFYESASDTDVFFKGVPNILPLDDFILSNMSKSAQKQVLLNSLKLITLAYKKEKESFWDQFKNFFISIILFVFTGGIASSIYITYVSTVVFTEFLGSVLSLFLDEALVSSILNYMSIATSVFSLGAASFNLSTLLSFSTAVDMIGVATGIGKTVQEANFLELQEELEGIQEDILKRSDELDAQELMYSSLNSYDPFTTARLYLPSQTPTDFYNIGLSTNLAPVVLSYPNQYVSKALDISLINPLDAVERANTN